MPVNGAVFGNVMCHKNGPLVSGVRFKLDDRAPNSLRGISHLAADWRRPAGAGCREEPQSPRAYSKPLVISFEVRYCSLRFISVSRPTTSSMNASWLRSAPKR